MSWTLVIVGITGIISADIKIHNIPMNNDLACIAAAKTLASKSKGLGFICINSNTGDVIEVNK